MEAYILIVTIVIILVKFLGSGCRRREESMPPGPTPVPLAGNFLQLMFYDCQIYSAFQKMSKYYGNIFTVRLGNEDAVILTEHDVTEVLKMDGLAESSWTNFLQFTLMSHPITITKEAPFHQDQLLQILRHFSTSVEDQLPSIISEEVHHLRSSLKIQMGDGFRAVVSMQKFFMTSVWNIIWKLVSGETVEHTKSSKLIECADCIFKSQKFTRVTAMFPILGRFQGKRNEVAAFHAVHDFCRNVVMWRRKREAVTLPRNFIDVFLREVDKGHSADKLCREEQLVCICTDFLLAASQAANHTLTFAILYLMLYPEVQEKVYQEIQTLDPASPPTPNAFRSGKKLSYTLAVMTEIQRISSVAPITPPRKLLKEVKFRGYTIPKNTSIFVNCYSLNYSSSHWKDPYNFRPERFLDANGHFLENKDLTNFGLGTIALWEHSIVFMFITSLLNDFEFRTISSHLNPSTVPVQGLLLSPQPFNAVVSLRT